MIVGIHHGGITVVDLERGVRHLQTLTGWTRVHRLDLDHPLVAGLGVSGAALIEGPNGYLEVLAVAADLPERRTVAQPGITHLSIQLPDMEAKHDQIRTSGVECHSDPVELGTGFSYLYVRDAEHNVVEVEGAAHAPADVKPWFSHVGIATNDVERLRATYENVMGAPAVATARIAGVEALDQVTALADADVTMTWVPSANANVELIQFHHPATGTPERRSQVVPGVGHVCFEVDNLDRDVAGAVGHGLRLVADPVTTEEASVARFEDPDGNIVEYASFHRKDDPLSLRTCRSLMQYREMDALLAASRQS